MIAKTCSYFMISVILGGKFRKVGQISSRNAQFWLYFFRRKCIFLVEFIKITKKVGNEIQSVLKLKGYPSFPLTIVFIWNQTLGERAARLDSVQFHIETPNKLGGGPLNHPAPQKLLTEKAQKLHFFQESVVPESSRGKKFWNFPSIKMH